MAIVLVWWLIIQLFGLAVLPLVRRVCRDLPDQGYSFTKTAGLLIIAYLVWFGAVTNLWPNSIEGITLALLLTACASLWLAAGDLLDGRARLRDWWLTHRAQILTSELLFLLCFVGWAVVRAFAPDKILPAGGEKYMEVAFLNGILNSPRLPPLDPWLSGFGISYYYFGFLMMAIMTRHSGALPTVGFDLYDALLFALTAQCAFGLVGNLVAASRGSARATRATGLLGALLVVGIGNLEGLLEGLYSARLLPQAFFAWLDIPDLLGSTGSGRFYPGDTWWWWRASRVLRDVDLQHNAVLYPAIDEFPFFSFLLGDNHPHKLALPFVLLCLGLALALYLQLPRRKWHFDPWLLSALAIGIGALGFLNTWDMPVLIALAALVILFRTSAQRGIDRLLLARAFLFAAGLGSAAVVLYIFFYIGFSSQAGGILPYFFPPTRLPQYLVMFGPFIWILAWFLPTATAQQQPDGFPWKPALRTWCWLIVISMGSYLLVLAAGSLLVGRMEAGTVATLQHWLGGLPIEQLVVHALTDRVANPWLLLSGLWLAAVALTYLLRREPPPLIAGIVKASIAQGAEKPAPVGFAVLLAFMGLALTLSVEFFYLRDNFGLRMNTVFKFYFQGWVLMACASAYALWWLATRTHGARRAIILTGSALWIASALVYPVMAVQSRVERLQHRPTLDAAASVAGFYAGHWAAQPDDWAAITWLNTTIRPSGRNPVILEAPGVAYENAGRISAFTGLPGLLGWQNHESQWRGSSEEQERRLADIEDIYTTEDASRLMELLHKWDVQYVIFGSEESRYLDRLCAAPENDCSPARAREKFAVSLTAVFTQGAITIYAVP